MQTLTSPTSDFIPPTPEQEAFLRALGLGPPNCSGVFCGTYLGIPMWEVDESPENNWSENGHSHRAP